MRSCISILGENPENRHKLLSLSVKDTIKNVINQVTYNNRNLFLTVKAGVSKIKVPADIVSGENPLCGS